LKTELRCKAIFSAQRRPGRAPQISKIQASGFPPKAAANRLLKLIYFGRR
jgi:hypothetical protein